MIKQGVKAGIYAGPFNFLPPNIVFCPLAAVPKRDSNKVRIIHNLSYPYNNSVNSHIEKHHSTVEYLTIDHCIQIISKMGKNCLIAKNDVKNAYHNLILAPDSFHFMGFSWDGQIYFSTTLPMGCSISCQRFECMSTAVQWILQNKLSVTHTR